MFVRKKNQLRIAYGTLTFASLSVLAYDASERSVPSFQSSQAERAQFHKATVPLPITPLAQSPFREARPDSALARTRAPRAASHEQRSVPSGVYFLTVAVQVNSGERPLALNRGTRVHLVREQDGKFLVRHNGTDFLVEKSQVTDDIGSLSKLARNTS